MKLDFVKNTKRNVIASFVNKAVAMLFPFLRKTLFMWVLGPGYLGLNGLLYSILGMSMLAELGFGTAIVCYMYKPVADDNKKLLCAYLKFFRKVYRCVGSAIFVVGLCLLPFLRRLIHGDIPADVNLHLVCNTSASYFLFAYRGSILGAHHRNDILTHIRTITSVVEFGTIALVLYFTHNYYHYVLVTILFTMLNNILLVCATRHLFPELVPEGDLPQEEVKRVLGDVVDLFTIMDMTDTEDRRYYYQQDRNSSLHLHLLRIIQSSQAFVQIQSADAFVIYKKKYIPPNVI